MNIKKENVLDKDLCESVIKEFVSSYFESLGSDEYDRTELGHENLLIQAQVAMTLYKKAAREGKPVRPLHYTDIALVDVMTEKLFRHLSEYVLELDFDEL